MTVVIPIFFLLREGVSHNVCTNTDWIAMDVSTLSHDSKILNADDFPLKPLSGQMFGF